MQNKLLITIIAIMLIWVHLPASSQVNMEDEPANLEGNKHCFDCHANKIYSYENEMTGRIDRKAMNPNFIYNPDDFYKGVHRHFSCTDCHSPDYETFPHQAELRLEEMYSCMDCHGGDPTYAQYHFDLIDDEFHKSVHSTKHDETFNCWMCHDPHSYRSMTRGNFKVSEIVTYHNNVCASCHDNPDHFQRISDSLKMPLEQIHSFLPNYKLHFSAVRCIECHTSVEDTMWVAHNILEKELAVKKCVECHSANTMLMSSLYKYQNIEARRNRGTLNAVFLNESYVIGANRNVYLNILSLVLFGMTILGIMIHVYFRIKSK
ncbi:MAG: cytochrome c3 family protein [Bacteroidetes bacterium]|nr:cytochrome c3 family protein [Bacteroidota bacterium]